MPEEKLPEGEMWFHDLRVSVFARRPFGLKDEKYNEFSDKVQKLIPAFNWPELTQYIEHKDENCIRGDIFKHPSAKKFEDLIMFDRGEAKQTQEMFDANEADYKRKVESGEIKEDLGEGGEGGDEGEGGEGDENNMTEEDIREWQKQQDEKAKARGGGGMKKVQAMLDQMGMEMVTEDDMKMQ